MNDKYCVICGTKFRDASKSHNKNTCSPKCKRALWLNTPEKRLDDLIRLRLTVLRANGTVITDDEREIIKAKLQDGNCDICGKKFPVNKLHIDHDHKTNHFRGVLCYNCNLMLGMASDNIDVLISSVTYLSAYKRPKQLELFNT